MIKWAIELAPYEISYEPRRAIKVQVLADFIAKCTTPHHENDQPEEPAAAWCCTWMDLLRVEAVGQD